MPSNRNRTVCLFASELSSVFRLNKYTPFESALLKIWERNDLTSFQIAAHRNQYENPKIRMQNKLANSELLTLAKESKTSHDVQHVIHTAAQLVPLAIHAQMALKAAQQKETDIEITTNDSHATTPPSISDSIDSKPTSNELILSALRATSASNIAPYAQTAKRFLSDTPTTTLSLLEKNKTAVKTLLQEISQHDDSCSHEAISLSKKQFGRESEVMFASQHDIQQGNAQLFPLHVVQGIKVVGKVDGFSNGKLVEIKHRVNRFFPGIPVYEMIQLKCYMMMTKVCEAQHIQVFQGVPRVTLVELEDQWADTFLIPNLKRFQTLYLNMLDNQDMQDRLFQRVLAQQQQQQQNEGSNK